MVELATYSNKSANIFCETKQTGKFRGFRPRRSRDQAEAGSRGANCGMVGLPEVEAAGVGHGVAELQVEVAVCVAILLQDVYSRVEVRPRSVRVVLQNALGKYLPILVKNQNFNFDFSSGVVLELGVNGSGKRGLGKQQWMKEGRFLKLVALLQAVTDQ